MFAGIMAQERKVERGQVTNIVYTMPLGHMSQVKGVEFYSLTLTVPDKSIINTHPTQ